MFVYCHVTLVHCVFVCVCAFLVLKLQSGGAPTFPGVCFGFSEVVGLQYVKASVASGRRTLWHRSPAPVTQSM